MSSLNNILNPQNDFDINSPRPSEKSSSNNKSPSSSSNLSENTAVEPGHYVQENMTPKQHEPHPDCPDTLACLPDTDGRPQHTLPVILRCAILGSLKKRLTIREIYAAMEDKYPYYKTAGPTWKQSVRHHLSLNRLFERQPRPVTDPGFGSYWTVNLAAPPGTKRPRKRGRHNKDAQEETGSGSVKRRGRPRKNVEDAGASEVPPAPALLPAARPIRRCRMSAIRTGGDQSGDDDEDDIMAFEEREDGEDEYESEEDMAYPFEHHLPLPDITFGRQGASSNSSPTLTRATFPRVRSAENPENLLDSNLIDRLHIEMAGLRRQSADAVSVSLRMSDQLAEAQAEVSRAKAALRTAESMLEDEARKRREAERAVDNEVRMRRAAEEALRLAQMPWDASPPSP